MGRPRPCLLALSLPLSLLLLLALACRSVRADVVSGDETTLYVVFNEARVSSFPVKVDKLTTLHFRNSCQTFPESEGGDIFFKLTSERPSLNQTKSVYKIYYDRAASLFYSVYTAVVYANEGTVTGILFDDGCALCGKGSCSETSYSYDNGTFSAVEESSSLSGSSCSRGPSQCDLKLTIVWSGTDGRGNKLYSGGGRFSRLAGFDSKSLKDSIDSL